MIRVASAAVGAVVMLGATSSAVLLFAGPGLGSGSVATPIAWYLPLVAGVSIAGLTWAMLSAEAREPDADVGRGVDSCCASCGGTIRSEWRLCPHCGERLNSDEAR